jgi:hypothetical protein
MNTQQNISEEVTVTTFEGQPVTLAGTINGVDLSGVLRVSLRRPLSEGTTVLVEAGGRYSTTGRVLYSLQHGDRHYATIGIQADERRREDRISVAETAQILSLQPHAPVNCRARVADVSKSGIGLITPIRIPRSVLLKVVLEGAIVFGEVRHCSPIAEHPESFKVGLEIETVVFRNEDPSNWLVPARTLWTALSVGFQSLAGHLRRDRNPVC